MEAEQLFRRATGISKATLARTRAQALLESAKAEEIAGLEGAVGDLTEGDQAYEAERWDDAVEIFARASVRLAKLRATNRWRQASLQIRAEAIDARKRAIEEGAEASASAQLSMADVAMTRGEAALEAGDARLAEESFEASRNAYSSALERARRAFRDANEVQREVVSLQQALQARGDCDAIQPQDAREHCIAANRELETGSAALAGSDAKTASRHFALSRELFLRTSLELKLWEATRPRAPELIERIPERAVVEIQPRQLCGFGVEVIDPNGDTLQYTWSIDGNVQDERGPALQRRLERDSTVTVKIADGSGGELIQQWRVEVASSP